MILFGHALKGSGDKLVKKFLSIRKSATAWLDNREYFE